jgi:hypothetical protein
MQIFPEKWTIAHIIGVVVVVCILAALLVLDANDKVFHALAIFTTIIGLLLVADQLVKMETTAAAAQAAATQATDSLTFLLRATEISRVGKLIDEVKQCNRDKKKEIAILRLQDIRNDLIFLMNNNLMKPRIDESQFLGFVQELGVMINGIDKDIQRQTNAVNYVEANKRLDKIATALVALDSQLKQ